DYDLNSKSSLSSSFRLQSFNNGSKGLTENSYSENGGPFYKLYDTDFDTKTSSLNYDASVDYKRTFKKKEQEFVLSAQYTNSNKDVDYDITQMDSLGTEFYKENSLNNSLNQELTFQADYVHPIKKWMTLETGAKTIFRTVDSDYDYEIYDFPSDAFVEDPLRSNVFNYSQDIVAAYGQANATVKNFGFRAGVRFEHTTVHGDFNQQIESFDKDYENVIPSMALSYTKPSKYMLKLSYTQRLQRPGMNYLNPYVNESDPLNISYGNPDLDPELSHAFEFGWNWFRKFGSINTTVYHRFTDNAIESVRFIDTNDVYVTTYGNVGENFSTGASIALNVMWQMKIFLGSNFNIYYYKVDGSGEAEGLTNDGINYSINLYGSYKFSKTWGIQAFGNFNGPKYSVQGYSTSFFYYNLSARREFKSGKGGVALGLDNFATWYMNFRNEYSGEGFTYDNNNKILFLGARISFDYRFGKMEFGAPKKKKRIKNDDLKDDAGDGGLMNGGGR
ncbi:MAG: TonB-dependent receptor family protein, partial [Bacteroidia bacterium]|nr:TonB-dependent receptor family protein [Bacteroidia bacterium]